MYKAFQKLGLFVLSDKLQFGTGCDTLVDVTGQERNRDNDYDDYYHSPPVALAAEASFDLAEDEIDFRQEARPVAFSANSNRIASNKVQQKFGSQAAPVNEEIEAPTIEIRNYFPETWLFDLINLDANGKSQIDLNAPDTVTTWIGDAFCTSDQTGVVIADESSFVVDQDFFVDLKMPFSIKRGEVFPINVTAFNKLNQKSLPLKLKVLDSDEIKLGGEEFEICVDAQDSQTQSFKIKAKELQEVNVTVQAKIESFKGCDLGNGNAEGITDKVQKPIQVKPEGFPIEKVTSEFLCRKTADEDETVVDLGQVELPDEDNLVEGSARAFITVSGDIMAPTMKNLDKLVKQPYGCGEQNMISMVPNIYVAKYIEGTNQNQPEIMAAAKKYMKSGYERQESKYRHRDGSYSVWGPRDEEAKGSVWLTAFVIKAFTQASQFIDIDSRDLRKSQEWLNRKQDRDTGCFKIEGFVIHSELAKDSDVALTASVLISMMEYNDERKRGQFDEEIDMGYRCLENALKNNTNTYAKTLATYAFALKEDHFKRSSELLDDLIESAHTDQPGKLFWTSKPESDGKIISSEDVEVTAYNVLSMIKHDKLSQALSAIKWLAGQRNAYGGFKSTQDTMIALQAMAEYSLAFEKSDNDLNLDVSAGDDKFAYEINEENELLLQSEKLTLNPEQLPKVSAKVSGKGCFMVQNILRYNVKQSPDQSSFELKVTQNQDNEVEVCAKYTGSAEKTNMVVTEIEMLSGFVPQDSSLKDLKGVKKVEFDEKTETLALYFNEMPKEELCLKFNVKEKVQIKDRKPAVAKVYDYYNQKDIVSIEYNVS